MIQQVTRVFELAFLLSQSDVHVARIAAELELSEEMRKTCKKAFAASGLIPSDAHIMIRPWLLRLEDLPQSRQPGYRGKALAALGRERRHGVPDTLGLYDTGGEADMVAGLPASSFRFLVAEVTLPVCGNGNLVSQSEFDKLDARVGSDALLSFAKFIERGFDLPRESGVIPAESDFTVTPLHWGRFGAGLGTTLIAVSGHLTSVYAMYTQLVASTPVRVVLTLHADFGPVKPARRHALAPEAVHVGFFADGRLIAHLALRLRPEVEPTAVVSQILFTLGELGMAGVDFDRRIHPMDFRGCEYAFLPGNCSLPESQLRLQ